MRAIRNIHLMLLMLVITGCAGAKYQSLADGGRNGFEESMISPNSYVVGYIGDSETTKYQTHAFALRRASEIASKEGKTHFIVTQNELNVQIKQIKGQYGTTRLESPSSQLRIRLGSIEELKPQATKNKFHVYDASSVMNITKSYALAPDTLVKYSKFKADVKDQILFSKWFGKFLRTKKYYQFLATYKESKDPQILEYVYDFVNTSILNDKERNYELGFLIASVQDREVAEFFASKKYLPEAGSMVAYALRESKHQDIYKKFKNMNKVEDWSVKQVSDRMETPKKGLYTGGMALYEKGEYK